ncbi:HAD-IIIA family hydrolase [bacterium]|nr:HAD-IIIA family hydrolase [bacterium]
MTRAKRDPVHQEKKIFQAALPELSAQWRREGKTVGYTSGVFDILHRGHVEYLTKAAEQCDILVVGVNSDSSVRQLKGPERPIQGEDDRLAVIVGLEAVSHAFLFSEKNNNRNIELLKPDLYLKAGDYDRSRLSSAPLVESYGGEIVFIPFVEGRSSTGVIEKIQAAGLAHAEPLPSPNPAPAAFLDRDGTICRHVQYLSEPEKFELLPGVTTALQRLQKAGYRLVVITNQPGIGFGYFTREDFYRVNLAMLKQLSGAGILIDKIYFSPATQAEQSSCRKPGTALGERAIAELALLREDSIMFGDAASDIEFAKNLGCMSCQILTEDPPEDPPRISSADGEPGRHFRAATLLEGVTHFLASAKTQEKPS